MQRSDLAFDGGCIPPILCLVVDSLISLDQDSALGNQKSGGTLAQIAPPFKTQGASQVKFCSVCLSTVGEQIDAAPKTVRGVSPQGP
jgi:hypothetical protein